ncbi:MULTISPECIES: SDR family NAD(P)-dependent oxidoreductase [unclassified Pseudofrankia]|uniref:SDR family NAD(P)-dependent oxidoreductase n=1 Tax=unclassified Pseudofrankia TaxID=2994372 RepID=UPI0008D9CD38|nr:MULTISPECIES: SDR family oxidoreductase [unclassified Pseudofrankia]MDT3446902.1 SDR family oxidoreductase [Pseudofrankia sp. BMG5.37]OHV49054.1 3-oxoacyl-ACP reductase [Pseudofrankia sp. BMG5.36]
MGVVEGRVALVTGGTRGIGRGIAEALLAEGARVVVNGRSEQKGRLALEEIGVPERTHFLAGDVRRNVDCAALVQGTVERFGAIDILVNNAGGGGRTATVAEMTDEDWDESLDWNLNHPFWCTRAALRNMIPRRWGRIINMSSMYGKLPLAGFAHYVTTKHALNGFTKAVAHETGTLGITCNALCPGVVLTDVWAENGPASATGAGMAYDDYVSMIVSGSAIKRPNTVDEVAAMAVLLCSPAGAGITGACLSVDGGAAPY